MKEEKIFESIADIDDKFIAEARVKTAKKKQQGWMKWTAIAACMCFMIAGTIIVIPKITADEPIHTEGPNDNTNPIEGKEDKEPSGERNTPSTDTGDRPSEGAYSTDKGDYPATIMVNGVNYYCTYNAVTAEIDESVIRHTTSYAENGVPEKDGEDNFNRETGTPYAVLEDGTVVVLLNNEWIEFKAN